jgi:thiopurine S-methyltransferase
MDEEFWLARWAKNDIGFHKNEPHHYLQRFFDLLQVRDGESFFVPLCGKSRDLLWLRDQGLHVRGIELSRAALEAFVNENQLSGEWLSLAALPCYCAQGYKLYCGDFFKLTAAALDGARAVYDRGAVVAFPPEMRARYARHLAALLPSGGRVLMVSYEYDQSETMGPPFSVDRQELESLFGPAFLLEPLAAEDSLRSHQGLAARGVTQLTEFAVLLIRR